jgi:hypothetical protein
LRLGGFLVLLRLERVVVQRFEFERFRLWLGDFRRGILLTEKVGAGFRLVQLLDVEEF